MTYVCSSDQKKTLDSISNWLENGSIIGYGSWIPGWEAWLSWLWRINNKVHAGLTIARASKEGR